MASKGSPINYIGVDVGTGSVRAGLFSSEGKLLAYNTCDIKLWTNEGFHEGSFEQSTSNIWAALCTTIQTIIKGVDPNSIKGIGFDATCSLVVVDTHGNPVTVSPSHDPERNIILWQDHRAIQEANEINELGHPLLKYVGGMVSPEMEPPKLLWLKRHLSEVCWSKAGHFFDLADYLVYRATNTPTRSLCTLVCKWGYIGHTPDDVNLQQGWNDSFWKQIGLEEFVNDKYNKIGTIVQAPGLPVGTGLSPRAAREFGLEVGTPVATALIDAHAGGLGMVGTDPSKVLPSLGQVPLSSRLALIAGTSSCHMATSNTPIFVPGVWGPYYSAMIPGTYLNEGGQSSSGSLLDSIIKCNSDLFLEVKERGRLRGIDVYKELEIILTSLTKERFLSHLSLLTTDFHILPDFHGNRSPLADPTLKGMIFGLSLTQSVHELAVMYLAAIQALAYNTRHIIETMIKHGHNFKSMFICGGLSHNHLFVQTHADITGMPVILTQEKEAVLLGAAILAATAAGEEIESVMMKMTHITSSSIVQPTDNPTLIEFHNKKYRVFQALYKDQYKYRKIMSDNLTDIKF